MTRKPISTISYNTEAFLKDRLQSMFEAHIIQAYMYIFHEGEDGDKDHFHVRIEPNSQDVDPMAIAQKFQEFVPGNDKPLGVRPFRASKEEDWFLYVVHDPEYLKMKYGGGDPCEKLPYKYTDIKVSPMYDLECAFVRAQQIKKHSSINLAQRIANGEDPLKLVLEGESVQTVNAIQRLVSQNDYKRLQRVCDMYVKKLAAIDNLLLSYNYVLDWHGDFDVSLMSVGGDVIDVEL